MSTPGAKTCPKCGRDSAENFTRPDRAGLHCHRDSTSKWLNFCGVIVCTCGQLYHPYTRKATR